MKKTITTILDAVEFDDKGKVNEEKTNKEGVKKGVENALK